MKNYEYQRNVIKRTIARIKEDKHAAARDKHAREHTGTGKPGTPASATPTPKAGNENAPDAKVKAKPKAKAKVEAVPVLPSPSPENHAKGMGTVQEDQVLITNFHMSNTGYTDDGGRGETPTSSIERTLSEAVSL
eukprot:s1743_g9.t1